MLFEASRDGESRESGQEVHSNSRQDWEQAKGREPGDNRSGNKYRHGGATRAVKWIRSLAEEGKAAKRTEQLLSPQSRRDWGRTGISKAKSREEGTGGGSREPRMKRAGNQDISEVRYQMKDENSVLCGITVFDQSGPNGSRVEKAATMADAL